jgi:hypothetical protein
VGLVNLEPILFQSPWCFAAAVGVPVAGKVIVVLMLARDADPKDRPGIIKAVAELFRWWRR